MYRWFALLAGLVAGMAQAFTPGPHNLEHQHDTVVPDKATTAFRITFPGAQCTACWGDQVTYTTFSGPTQTFAAKRYDGRYITLLIPVTHPREAEVTEDRLRVLVDRLDLLYMAYRDLLGWEPTKFADPLGKQVFAVLPNEPSNFYGLAFVPGDSSEYSNAVLGERALDDDILSNVWVHELAHNFDPVGQWDYGPDSAHEWTTILQTWFARRQAHMDEVGRTTWEAFEASLLTGGWKDYRDNRNPAITWQLCAATAPRPNECVSANAYYLTGSLMVELAKHITGAQMADWMRRALAAQTAGATFTGAEARSDFMLAMLAEATRTDTRCIATRFRWYQGAGLASAAQYNTLFPGCLDSDNDGAKRFDDCDDANAAVNPGASELADGRDNDCDGQIDETAVAESSVAGGDFGDNSGVATPVGAAPILISGSFAERPAGSALDVDHVRLASTIGPVTLRVCATGSPVFVGGISTSGVGWGPLASAVSGGCGTTTHTFETWRGFWVDRGSNNTLSGSYTLEITVPPGNAWPRPAAVKLIRATDGSVDAVIDPANVQGGLAGAELRWYQTGQGERARGPASDGASLQAPALTAAAFNDRRPVQLRAQLWRNGLPIEEPSNPIWFPSSAHLNPVTPDGRHSGAWYSPRHNGEGFFIEMLPNNRFLAYWFTYDPASWNSTVGNAPQHWLLADGVVDGKVLRANLTRVSGGGFGSAMNPTQLVLTTVGEIEFLFAGDNQGSVHYRVDGRTGEFELERLTQLRTGAGTRGLSGSWYQPSLRGQGLIVQETTTNNELLAIMFTFDQFRRPAWALMQGSIAADGSISFAAAPFRARGGLFGRGYRNSSIVNDVAGAATLMLSCSSGRYTIQLPAIAAATQTLTLERITTPLGAGCPSAQP